MWGTPGISYTLSFDVSTQAAGVQVRSIVAIDDQPTVTPSPYPCVITSGNGAQDECTLQIFAKPNTPSGNYFINTVATPSNSGTIAPINLSPLPLNISQATRVHNQYLAH